MKLDPAITSRSNARVKALRAAMSGRAAQPGDALGLEGEHLLAEALRSGLAIESIFVRAGSEAVLHRPSLRSLPSVSCFVLNHDVFASVVDTVSPQGIAAIVRIPQPVGERTAICPAFTLIVEQLQDAGNLGTLLRTAEAFGFTHVFATPGTVNEWNPKVVRSSAGSVFRVPVVRDSLDRMKTRLRSSGVKLFAAVAQAEAAVPVMHADLKKPCALMVGNEGAGLSQAALEIADARVHIPCAVESLNAAVAGATLMYEAFRQHLACEEHASAHGGPQ